MLEYAIKKVDEHYELFVDDDFICSFDSLKDAVKALEEEQSKDSM